MDGPGNQSVAGLGLRHRCGGEIRVMLRGSQDGTNTETWASCSNCGDAILIHTGAWEDERFLAAIQAYMAKAEA